MKVNIFKIFLKGQSVLFKKSDEKDRECGHNEKYDGYIIWNDLSHK